MREHQLWEKKTNIVKGSGKEIFNKTNISSLHQPIKCECSAEN